MRQYFKQLLRRAPWIEVQRVVESIPVHRMMIRIGDKIWCEIEDRADILHRAAFAGSGGDVEPADVRTARRFLAGG